MFSSNFRRSGIPLRTCSVVLSNNYMEPVYASDLLWKEVSSMILIWGNWKLLTKTTKLSKRKY